jgi:hypothetical protein
VKRILTAFRQQSCLGNTTTACRFLVITEYVLNREMKKLTNSSSDILVALIRRDHWGRNAPRCCSKYIV